jgi:transposase
MVVGVDQYKRIRKMAAEDELSQREIARRLGISRNTVARYCKGEHMPWESAKRDRKPGVVNQDIEQFIRSCLEHDKDPDVPKKQHHTARRIYERLVTEKGFTGGESTIRRWVNRIRDEAGEAYMPLHFVYCRLKRDKSENEKIPNWGKRACTKHALRAGRSRPGGLGRGHILPGWRKDNGEPALLQAACQFTPRFPH